MRAYICPQCSCQVTVPSSEAELTVTCPTCQRVFVIPGESPFVFLSAGASGQPRIIARKRSNVGVYLLLLLTSVVGIGVAAFIKYPAIVDKLAELDTISMLPDADPDLVAIRKYLTESLNSPHWQEVRWWPARYDESNKGAERISQLKADLPVLEAEMRKYQARSKAKLDRFGEAPVAEAQYEKAKKELELLQAAPREKYCRLKYRTKSFFGPILNDTVFLYKDGAWQPVDNYHNDYNRLFEN